MATESFYRVSVVVEAISPDEQHEPQAPPLKVVARSDGALFLREDQALAYMGQAQDVMRVFCDPQAC